MKNIILSALITLISTSIFINNGYTFNINSKLINKQAEIRIHYMADILSYPSKLPAIKKFIYIKSDTIPKDLLIDGNPLDNNTRQQLEETLDVEHISDDNVTFGWINKRTSMKMYPTSSKMYTKTPDIDYNQYTLVEPFIMAAILHSSLDKQWLYVQLPYMRGWVKKDDITYAEKSELIQISKLPFAVITESRYAIDGKIFGLGTKLPILHENDDNITIMLPDKSKTVIGISENINIGYKEISEDAVKDIALKMIGEPYNWGGYNGFRDCSAYVKDIFEVFGIHLPRNSSQQMAIGREIISIPLDANQLYLALDNAEAFKTLIFFRGHVMLYGGKEYDDYVIYHAVRTLNGMLIDKVEKTFIKRDYPNMWEKVISIRELQ